MTSIEWTDETWNPVTGCSRVSEGCRHCYIERTPPFRMAGRKVGDPVQLHPDRLDQPLHWTKPRRVFVNSLSDLFHEEVPFPFIHAIFGTIRRTPQHTYQILTKRPARMLEVVSLIRSKEALGWANGFYSHLWLGVSIEDQPTADERIPILLQTPAAVRFVSVEPLLGPVNLLYSAFNGADSFYRMAGIHWVIGGGESGPQARPCDLAWIRSIVRQCQAARVPCFVKQLGAFVVDRNDAGFEGEEPTNWPMDTRIEDDPFGEHQEYQGRAVRLRLHDRKGGDPAEWPEDLRVREWPVHRPMGATEMSHA